MDRAAWRDRAGAAPAGLKTIACIALGLAGALLAVLFVLLMIEAHQDRVLNGIAGQENQERERGGRF